MAPKRHVSVLLLVLVGLFVVHADDPSTCRATADGRKLHVAIYYECLCPGSRLLITDDLLPMYDEIKNHVELHFVPFGNARSINGGRRFRCQHGTRECTGNRIQSCVLDALDNEQNAAMAFVGCQMKKRSDATGRVCTESVNVTYDALSECKTGPKGVELQLAAEKETNDAGVEYVPFVVFNHTPNEKEQDDALQDLRKAVCEKLAEIYCAAALPSPCT